MELAGGATSILNSQQHIALWKLLTSVGAQGKRHELTSLPGEILRTSAPSPDNTPPTTAALPTSTSPATTATTAQTMPQQEQESEITTILAVGLGDIDDLSDEDIRFAAGSASRHIGTAHTVVTGLSMFSEEAALLGHALGAYTYSGQKKEQKKGIETILAISPHPSSSTRNLSERVSTVAKAVAFARDLVNAPANDLYPQSYADIIRSEAEPRGLHVEILDEVQLQQHGFGGILGVGQGSQRPPRLLRMTYTPAEATDKTPTVALVGKGVTFDTGGISLKPGANMWNMVSDMAGSAAVAAALFAAADLKLALTVIATIPLAENMPSGSAIRPGDILRHYGGLTTEVLNTDAEGRLILADAIVRACEDQPDYLIETSTLTGAQVVALGDRTPGIMGSIHFRDRVAILSQQVGENGWPMPLPAELGEALTSDVADLRNISESRWGGMSVAGHYLANFVAKDVQWVHIDVAGPAYNTGAPYGYNPKRGTGVPVRTIVAVLESLAAQEPH